MKIGHFQLQCNPGNYAANAEKVYDGLAAAHQQGIEIISFPESFLTGLFVQESAAREHSLAIDSPEITTLLQRTKRFTPTWMTGFNELRGAHLFNTVIVVERGELLGYYSKAFPEPYFKPGREFPVFARGEVKFGVVICADGGYIEPVRILALKGAQLIFAPHYNYIKGEALIDHFQKVRADHTARAIENDVWFFRGNNVVKGFDQGLGFDGVGYGESYLLDPKGELAVRGQRHQECLISIDIEIKPAMPAQHQRSRRSAEALGPIVQEVLGLS